MGSIRFKLAALTGAVATLAVLAALAVLLAVGAAERALEATVTSQQRLDLLTELSARMSDFGLAAVAAADSPGGGPGRMDEARARVATVLETVAREALAQEAAPRDAAGSPPEAPGINPRARMLAHLRADFAILDRQITAAAADADPTRRGDRVRGALNGFAAAAGPTLSLLVESERRSVAAAREEAQALAFRLRAGAVALALVALGVAALLYRALARPLLARLSEIDRAAAAIGRGHLDTRLAIGPRDELGVLMARFNRMAARLARREARVAHDRAELEETIAARTADLTAANARLGAIDASRRRFFADVSHELRTPLTVIIGECDVTARAPAIADADARGAFATIRKRAGRMHRRVEDLLRIARSESGEISLVFQDVPLGPVLAEAIAGLENTARRQGVALTLEAAQPGPVVHADRDWLRQVVEGLVDNALRHGAPLTRITVAAEAVAGAAGETMARITVTDDGRGIPQDARAGLFARFARGERPGPGFGVGLALAEWVVTRHGGRITLEAAEGGGTRAVIVLFRPDARTDAHKTARAAAAGPPREAASGEEAG